MGVDESRRDRRVKAKRIRGGVPTGNYSVATTPVRNVGHKRLTSALRLAALPCATPFRAIGGSRAPLALATRETDSGSSRGLFWRWQWSRAHEAIRRYGQRGRSSAPG